MLVCIFLFLNDNLRFSCRVELRSNEDVFTVLPDRSEGAASLVDGQLELMLHR